MKKIAITGASVVLAAMPMVSAIAANPAAVQDELEVTVAESCTFARESGQAKYSKPMTAGQVDTAFGSNTFKSQCNNGKGYTVTGVFTDLTHTDSAGTAIEYGTVTPATGSAATLGIWTANNGTDNVASGSTVFQTNAADPAGGSSFTMTYKVGLHDNQEQGTYTGTATYTLAQKTT